MFTETLIKISAIKAPYLFNIKARPDTTSTIPTKVRTLADIKAPKKAPASSDKPSGAGKKFKNLLSPKTSTKTPRIILITIKTFAFIMKYLIVSRLKYSQLNLFYLD